MSEFHLDSVRIELKRSIESLNNQITLLKESLFSESKSTAGDKHETGRASIQLEIEQIGHQLKLKEEMLAELDKQKFNSGIKTIQVGSFVKTNIGEFVLSVAVGKLNESSVFAVSLSSPFARLAMGLSEGDKFSLNGKEIEIFEIS